MREREKMCIQQWFVCVLEWVARVSGLVGFVILVVLLFTLPYVFNCGVGGNIIAGLAALGTGLVVVWYAWETRKMAEATQTMAREQIRPVLLLDSWRGTDNKVTPDNVFLINVGAGAAFNVYVEGTMYRRRILTRGIIDRNKVFVDAAREGKVVCIRYEDAEGTKQPPVRMVFRKYARPPGWYPPTCKELECGHVIEDSPDDRPEEQSEKANAESTSEEG